RLSFDHTGSFDWQAVYSCYAENDGTTSATTTGLLALAPPSPAISTTLSASTANIGDPVHDSATLSGATAGAGGTVTYTAYTDNTDRKSVGEGRTVAITNGRVTKTTQESLDHDTPYTWKDLHSC